MPTLGLLNISNDLTVSDGTTTVTLTWSSGNSRFENSDYYLRQMQIQAGVDEYKWKLYKIAPTGDTNESTNSQLWNNTDPKSPCEGTWSNSWNVTCGGAGAQGDPHVKPFFGKGYTI